MSQSIPSTKPSTSPSQAETHRDSRIPLESPFRRAPLIREIIRPVAGTLLSSTGFLRKSVEAGAPCFAIRTSSFDDLSMMCNALPVEVWELIKSTFSLADILSLLSTSVDMRACVQKHIDKAEKQYGKSAEKILEIEKNDSLNERQARKKLRALLDQQSFVELPLSRCTEKANVLQAIHQNSTIRYLHVEAKNLAPGIDGKRLASSLGQLRHAIINLDISENNHWLDSDFEEICRFLNSGSLVISLSLGGNHLRTSEKDRMFFPALYSQASRIESIFLAGGKWSGNCLSNFGMAVLAYSLMSQQPRTLKTIDLSNTSNVFYPVESTNDAAYSRVGQCEGNAALQQPWFVNYHKWAKNNDKTPGFELIIKALKTNSTITSIDLSSCKIDDRLAKVLAASLRKNKSLQTLSLASNLIGNSGIKMLAKAIWQHPAMKTLNLASNEKIGESGWAEFLGALPDNAALCHLNLSSCMIGDEGAIALARRLKTNRSLRELILPCTSITAEGMVSLADSIKDHPSLKLLDSAGNTVSLAEVSVS